VTYSQSFTTLRRTCWLTGSWGSVRSCDWRYVRTPVFLVGVDQPAWDRGDSSSRCVVSQETACRVPHHSQPLRGRPRISGSKPGHSRRAGGQSDCRGPSQDAWGTIFVPDAPQSDFRIRKWGSLASERDSFLVRKIGTRKDQTDEDCGLLLVGRNLGQEIEARGSWQRWAVRRGARRHVQLLHARKPARVSWPGRGSDATPNRGRRWVGEIGYVKVWPKPSEGAKRADRLPDLTVPDSEFQWSFHSWVRSTRTQRHSGAGEMLRVANKGRRLASAPWFSL